MSDLFSFEITAHTKADPKTAFAAVATAPEWARWGKPIIGASWWEREGTTDPQGPGAVRAMGPVRGGPALKEEILELEPGKRIVYRFAGPITLPAHRGELSFTADDDGTEIHWRVQFEEPLLATGPMIRAGLRTLVQTLSGKLVRYLDRRA